MHMLKGLSKLMLHRIKVRKKKEIEIIKNDMKLLKFEETKMIYKNN